MENNILIAKFEGLEVTTDGISDLYYDENGGLNRIKDYRNDWGALMGGVEKINTMDDFNYSVSINYHYTSIADNNTLYDIVDVDADGDTQKGCYKAVVEFIKEYNKKQ